ncbi:MAG: GAF domain-containing protein, partial [Nitrospinae bacterium]|nr:GAF domain-containing protein [Nitrospinota bacterium]
MSEEPSSPAPEGPEERLRKLAADKSYLQLLIHMINRVSSLPGLENTVQNLLSAVADSIGGTNAILYYLREGEWLRVADLYGRREEIREIDDPLVAAVFQNRAFVERADDFSRTLMETEEFGKAYTWAFPLTVGEDLVGVFKLENLHIGSAPWLEHLTTFFHFAALALN